MHERNLDKLCGHIAELLPLIEMEKQESKWNYLREYLAVVIALNFAGVISIEAFCALADLPDSKQWSIGDEEAVNAVRTIITNDTPASEMVNPRFLETNIKESYSRHSERVAERNKQ